MNLIPSLDLRGGRCVRLFKGDFAAETRYEIDPETLRARYAALGAPWMHVVDLDGARDGALGNRAVIVRLAAVGAPALQVGGGLRARGDVEALLRDGVQRAVIGSAAVERPDEVRGWLRDLGAARVCLALDVRIDSSGVPLLQTRGWREGTAVSLWDLVASYLPAGLAHVLCTDIDRDGALAGPSLDLYREAVRRFPTIAWQASGGVRHAADLAALAQTGVAGAISGKALLEGRMTDEELRPFLPNA